MKKIFHTIKTAGCRSADARPVRNPAFPNRFRRTWAYFFVFAPVVISGASCVSAARTVVREIPVTAAPVEEAWEIVRFRQSGGGAMPEWVERYLAGGSRLVEEMPAFTDSYVFVSEDEGVSFAALERRGKDFDPARDFAPLAALRVTRRLAVLGGGNPDMEFSRYHETMVRAVADAAWSPAPVEDDFWLLKAYPGDGETVEPREAYVFLVLVTVDQETFRAALDGILWHLEPVQEGERDHAAIIRRIRPVFYDEF